MPSGGGEQDYSEYEAALEYGRYSIPLVDIATHHDCSLCHARGIVYKRQDKEHRKSLTCPKCSGQGYINVMGICADDPKTQSRPHIVCALFPPFYWALLGFAGLMLAYLVLGRDAVQGRTAVYAIAAGCGVGGIFAAPVFRAVCGYFERRAESSAK